MKEGQERLCLQVSISQRLLEELLALFFYQHPDRLAAIGVESVWAFSYH
jgi:hypothetical protein